MQSNATPNVGTTGYSNGYYFSMVMSFLLVLFGELAENSFSIFYIYLLKVEWFFVLLLAFLGLLLMNFFAIVIGYLIGIYGNEFYVNLLVFLLFLVYGSICIFKSYMKPSISSYESHEDTIEEAENDPNANQNYARNPESYWAKIFVYLLSIELASKSEISIMAISSLSDINSVIIGSCSAYALVILIITIFGKYFLKIIYDKYINMIYGGILILYAGDLGIL